MSTGSSRRGLIAGRGLRPQGLVSTRNPQRIASSLRRSATATCRVGPHPQCLLNGFCVQERDRCMTIFALALVFQIDRRSAGRAGNLAHLRPNTLELARSQVANELFLPQELKKRRESPVASAAHEI